MQTVCLDITVCAWRGFWCSVCLQHKAGSNERWAMIGVPTGSLLPACFFAGESFYDFAFLVMRAR
jgi:hypothetical protein